MAGVRHVPPTRVTLYTPPATTQAGLPDHAHAGYPHPTHAHPRRPLTPTEIQIITTVAPGLFAQGVEL